MLYLLKNWRNAYRRPSPWNPLNHHYETIFIHIPKNAGISVGKALFDAKVGHAALYRYHFHNRRAFYDYFKFTIVRNPLDRLVSAYSFLQAGGLNDVDAEWAQKWLSAHSSFEEFCLSLQDSSYRRRVLSWLHFRPQWMFLVDLWGRLNIDYIGRFEQLGGDFNSIAAELGIDASLSHINVSRRNHDWRTYYSTETAEIVKTIYAKDISLLGYERETLFDGETK